MKKLLTIFFAFVAIAACTVEPIAEHNRTIDSLSKELSNTKSETSQIYFHKGTQLFLQEDGAKEEKLPVNDPSVTHVVRKYYPKNTEEQFRITNCREIQTSYIPFGYVPVRIDEMNLKGSSVEEFPDKNKSRVILDPKEAYKDIITDTNEHVVEGQIELELPVIYAICPVGANGLEGIEHEDEYGLSFTGTDGGRLEHFIRFPLVLRNRDSLLDSLLPLQNIKVQAQYGPYLAEKMTQQDGLADLNLHFDNITESEMGLFSVTVVLETPKWVIARNSTTTPIHLFLGTTGFLWPFYQNITTTRYRNLESVSQEYEIHRAVNHYHYVQHDLSSSINANESGVLLHAIDSSHVSYLGYSWPEDKEVFVFNYSSEDNKIIGTTLHEIGHIRQYWNRYPYYYSIDKIVRESYASFVGWYLGESYYFSKGYTRPSSAYHINTQHRQTWRSGLTGDLWYYSPIFVDFIDDLNQGLTYSVYPYDNIQDVPSSIMDQMGLQCSTLDDCWDYLENVADTTSFFTTEQLNLYKSRY